MGDIGGDVSVATGDSQPSSVDIVGPPPGFTALPSSVATVGPQLGISGTSATSGGVGEDFSSATAESSVAGPQPGIGGVFAARGGGDSDDFSGLSDDTDEEFHRKLEKSSKQVVDLYQHIAQTQYELDIFEKLVPNPVWPSEMAGQTRFDAAMKKWSSFVHGRVAKMRYVKGLEDHAFKQLAHIYIRLIRDYGYVYELLGDGTYEYFWSVDSISDTSEVADDTSDVTAATSELAADAGATASTSETNADVGSASTAAISDTSDVTVATSESTAAAGATADISEATAANTSNLNRGGRNFSRGNRGAKASRRGGRFRKAKPKKNQGRSHIRLNALRIRRGYKAKKLPAPVLATVKDLNKIKKEAKQQAKLEKEALAAKNKDAKKQSDKSKPAAAKKAQLKSQEPSDVDPAVQSDGQVGVDFKGKGPANPKNRKFVKKSKVDE